MNSTASPPPFGSAHVLITNASILFGIGVFLHQVWGGASLDSVLLTAGTSGLMAYLTLALGVAAARHIIAHSPDSDSSEESPAASSDQPSADPTADEAENTPEPQVA